jgi:hypothetical protein
MNKMFMGLVLQALGIIIIMLRESSRPGVHGTKTYELIGQWESQTREFTNTEL